MAVSAAVTEDHRQGLWRASFDTLYDSLFEELIASALVNRWSGIDSLVKILVALTASGSAIAGWTIWNTPTGKVIWAIASGIAAALSILQGSVGLSNRIKAHSEDLGRFTSLRVNLETFRYRMEYDNVAFDKLVQEFNKFREKWNENLQSLSSDALRTTALEKEIDNQVRTRLANQIA
jgi:hypothetical protein